MWMNQKPGAYREGCLTASMLVGFPSNLHIRVASDPSLPVDAWVSSGWTGIEGGRGSMEGRIGGRRPQPWIHGVMEGFAEKPQGKIKKTTEGVLPIFYYSL